MKSVQLRPGQHVAFDVLNPEQFGILNGPTGWGKSTALVALTGAQLLDDPRRKAVVAIPQSIIAKGFVPRCQVRLPDGRLLDWQAGSDLCQHMAGKLDALRAFLLDPPGRRLRDRVVVTTHANLAHTFRSLSGGNLDRAFRRTSLVVDEAHHVQASQDACNLLGDAVTHLLDGGDPSVRLLLATAHFFRGDRLPILRNHHADKFCRHHVPFDQYWSELQHLRSYSYDFVTFKGSVWAEFEALLSAEQVPTIVYCPPEGHSLHLGKPKQEFVRRATAAVLKHYPDAVLWTPGLQACGKKAVIDLVSTERRAEKVRFVMEHGPQVAAVLSVGMFREGADWVQAARVIDMIPSNSDQDRNQRFGRLVRDCEGKKHVRYYSFFPAVTSDEPEEQRRALTALFAYFQASLVIDNAILPIKVPANTTKAPAEAGEDRAAERVDLLGRLDSQQQQNVLAACFDALVSAAAEAESKGRDPTHAEARRAIVSVLDGHGVREDQEALATQIVLLLRRRQSPDLPVLDLVEAGFDKVWAVEALHGLRLYSSGVSGAGTFREVRDLLNGAFEKRWSETFDQVRELTVPPPTNSSSYWWVTHNKVLREQGQLPSDKCALLEQIPWWRWQVGFADRWQQRYEAIAALAECPKAGTTDYAWVRQQRRLHAAGRLPKQKVETCESIRWWRWDTTADAWDENYERLKRLDAAPAAASPQYDFVKYQRRRHSEGRLSADRQRLLEMLPWWSWKGTGQA